MNTILRFLSAAATITLILAVFVVLTPGQDGGRPVTPDRTDVRPKPRVEPTPLPTPGKKTALLFPEVEGWNKSEKTKYPTAALGYSYTYESTKGGRVTIYIYNGGNSKISDDIKDETVVEHFEALKDEIIAVGKMGLYQNVKVVKSSTATIGDTIDSHYALVNFTAQGRKIHSEIYLFTFENNFIKIRATRDPENADSEEFKSLLAELGTIFEK